ncbi:unnamed protein product [Cladocopium goreaui]|uniref:Uncharacterized protein n=1 Tax=Cladocopium goreaui TaxID=2562237 RepID=A0A9P1DL23_9DINO|nr:unnamed protein product [Cladocopium goreaui]
MSHESHDGYPQDGPMEELAELQIKEEARLEKLFQEQRQQQGLDDDSTLNTFFQLFDMWIQLYRLNKCMEVLEEVVPICRRRGGLSLEQERAQARIRMYDPSRRSSQC